jgi:glutamate-1-semialdehyde 2,1-aminomutase
MNAGIPESVRRRVLRFPYNDLEAVAALFAQHPGCIACLVLEAARTVEPHDEYLRQLKALAHANGALLVFDEMITGFRWHLRGAQHVYGAIRRDVMCIGGSDHDRDRVFLLSTTHGAETHALAAAIATIGFYTRNQVIETLYASGKRLRAGLDRAIADHGLKNHFALMGRDCNLLFATLNEQGQPSQAFRTLFMQEMIRRGIIAPSFVVSWSHTEADIDRTVEAAHEALRTYRRALEDGVERHLQGRAVKPVFRQRP